MPTPPHRILIVDDDPGVGQLLVEYLQSQGFFCFHVMDGHTCLEVLSETHWDLVLLDIKMPGMGGFEVLQGIRGSFSRLQLPVILVTGQAASDFVIKGFELGANDYITKPFEFNVVNARVSCQLSMRGLGEQKDHALLSAHVLEVGSKVNHYEILSCLGKGGMGAVYRVRDTQLDREVALKTLHPGATLSPKQMERFRQEAKILAQINHPCIVKVYDFCEKPIPFFTMEYVEGQSLDKLQEHEQLEPAKICGIGVAIAQALKVAHAHGVIHRDIKPSNVILEANGQIRLLDFGTAKVLESAGLLTETRDVVGTPSYMAPELLEYHREATPHSDIYALGALIYELLSGQPPFVGSPIKVLWAVVNQAPASLVEQGHSPQLEQVIFKALAKDPVDRYSSAEAFAQALKSVIPLWTKSQKANP